MTELVRKSTNLTELEAQKLQEIVEAMGAVSISFVLRLGLYALIDGGREFRMQTLERHLHEVPGEGRVFGLEADILPVRRGLKVVK